jgi:hypothetical protein
MALPDVDVVLGWRDREVLDRDGQKVGKLRDLFLDSQTDRPEWAGVSTGFLGRKLTLVPLANATEAEGAVRVAFTEQQIKDAPRMDPDMELSQSEEEGLYRHYGLGYSRSESATGLPPGARADEDETVQRRQDVGATRDRAPEQKAGTEVPLAQPMRLKRYVVEGQGQKTIPVEHEEIRVERDPSD